MPTIGIFQRNFRWNFSDTNAAPVHVGKGGYPAWQASNIIGSGFGPIGAWFAAKWAQYIYWRDLKRRFEARTHAQRALLLYTLDLLEQPAYTAAKTAVAETAHTLGFNKPETWVKWSRLLKDDLGRQENHYRHLRAMVRTRELIQPSTLTNPCANYLTELAYQEYAIQPWTVS